MTKAGYVELLESFLAGSLAPDEFCNRFAWHWDRQDWSLLSTEDAQALEQVFYDAEHFDGDPEKCGGAFYSTEEQLRATCAHALQALSRQQKPQ